MGILNPFKKKSSPPRTATINAPAKAFYDMLARKVSAQSASLSPESVENIRALLTPLSRMGADIDAQLEKIKVEVDKSGADATPATLILRTTVNGKPMGPQTTFTVEAIDARSCRVSGTMTVPTGGGVMDRLMLAGLSRRIEQDSKTAFDQPITDAAKSLGADATFKD